MTPEMSETVHKIIKYFKNEMMEKLLIALEPFRDEIEYPLDIIIRIGSKE